MFGSNFNGPFGWRGGVKGSIIELVENRLIFGQI